LATSFPFPKGFFSVICFRFLPSSSDGHWPFILSECKRVLQPGGHLEVTLLDADLMNAGPRAQRAVDLVKAIMQRENPTEGSAYRPASEKVLRILGKKGFEDMSKCFVGLPAVGKVDSHSEMEQGERERSPDDPESINEVVSQVGRYWYTRCYEGVITAQGEHMQRSMWHDRGLLRECRKRRTNFKMMVCCARKPLSARRGSDAVSTMTASAPAVAAATTPA
jgi:SAM-dependent methyltransferase